MTAALCPCRADTTATSPTATNCENLAVDEPDDLATDVATACRCWIAAELVEIQARARFGQMA